MPCRVDPTPEELAQERRRAAERIAAEKMDPLLCSACRVLDRLGYDFDENPELSKWWDKHKREDNERIERERQIAEKKKYKERVAAEAVKKPVADLTREEKTILKELGFL